MKNLFFLFSIIFLSSTVFAQSKPPKKIRDAFELYAPQAKEVKWSGEGDRYKEWTAVYLVNADSMLTRYDHKANWLITLNYIPIDDLPEKIKSSIKNEYMGSKITRAAKMQEDDFDGYGVAFTYKKDQWAIAITAEGKVTRRKMSGTAFDFN